jgi:phosphoribosylformylglycinamidine cyclo-ligase
MLQTFNCGIGLVAVAEPAKAGAVIDAFQAYGDRAWRIGRLIAAKTLEPAVRYTGTLFR